MKVNDIINEGFLDNIVASWKAKGDNPQLAGLSDEQKKAYFLRQPQIQKLSDVARQMWEKQVLAIMQANSTRRQGMTIDDQEYQQRLNQFVEQIIINQKMSELGKEDLDRMNKAVAKVIGAKNNNDKRAMDKAFDDLISVGTVARVSSPSTSTGAPTPGPKTKQPPPTSRSQAQNEVEQVFKQVINASPRNLQAIGATLQQVSNNSQVRSTGDMVADAVLTSLGYRVS